MRPCGTYGPCDRRKTCVRPTASTTVGRPAVRDRTTCTAARTARSSRTAATAKLLRRGPTARATCATSCMDFAGYCHAARRLRRRPLCDARRPDRGPRRIRHGGQAATLATSLGQQPRRLHADGAGADGRADVRAAVAHRQHADHRVAVVLVTDGLPLGVHRLLRHGQRHHPPGLPARRVHPERHRRHLRARRGGAMGAGGTPAVPTFVIGVFAPGGAAPTAQTKLDMLARPARTRDRDGRHHRHQPERRAALQNALKEVQSKAIACEYKLPADGVDFKKVNVSFTSGSGADTAIGHAPIDGTERRRLRRARRLVLRQGSRHRHADQDHRLPGQLLDVPDRPERPRRRRARLPDRRRRVAPAAAAAAAATPLAGATRFAPYA